MENLANSQCEHVSKLKISLITSQMTLYSFNEEIEKQYWTNIIGFMLSKSLENLNQLDNENG